MFSRFAKFFLQNQHFAAKFPFFLSLLLSLCFPVVFYFVSFFVFLICFLFSVVFLDLFFLITSCFFHVFPWFWSSVRNSEIHKVRFAGGFVSCGSMFWCHWKARNNGSWGEPGGYCNDLTVFVYHKQGLQIYIWRFPEIGVPSVIIHFDAIFHEINHPFVVFFCVLVNYGKLMITNWWGF